MHSFSRHRLLVSTWVSKIGTVCRCVWILCLISALMSPWTCLHPLPAHLVELQFPCGVLALLLLDAVKSAGITDLLHQRYMSLCLISHYKRIVWLWFCLHTSYCCFPLYSLHDRPEARLFLSKMTPTFICFLFPIFTVFACIKVPLHRCHLQLYSFTLFLDL